MRFYNRVVMLFVAVAIAARNAPWFNYFLRLLNARICSENAIWDDFQNNLELFLKGNDHKWHLAQKWLRDQFQAHYHTEMRGRLFILVQRTRERREDILAEKNGGFYGHL